MHTQSDTDMTAGRGSEREDYNNQSVPYTCMNLSKGKCNKSYTKLENVIIVIMINNLPV